MPSVVDFLTGQGVVGLFDPALVVVELGLPVPVTVRGIAAVDGAIKLTSPQRWNVTEGCDGEVMRRRVRLRRGTLQLALMQTSLTLDALAAAHLVDDATGTGVFSVAVIDVNGAGNRLMYAERAWQPGPPPEVNYASASPVFVFLELDGVEVVHGSIRRAL